MPGEMLDLPPTWDTDLKRFGWAPGNYYCHCIDCEKIHTADKRARRCEPCARRARAAFNPMPGTAELTE